MFYRLRLSWEAKPFHSSTVAFALYVFYSIHFRGNQTKPNPLLTYLSGIDYVCNAGYVQRAIKSRVCFFRIYLSEYGSINISRA